jgi:hypothetical protein
MSDRLGAIHRQVDLVGEFAFHDFDEDTDVSSNLAPPNMLALGAELPCWARLWSARPLSVRRARETRTVYVNSYGSVPGNLPGRRSSSRSRRNGQILSQVKTVPGVSFAEAQGAGAIRNSEWDVVNLGDDSARQRRSAARVPTIVSTALCGAWWARAPTTAFGG